MIKKILPVFFIAAFLLSLPSVLYSQDVNFPKYRGYTNDFANILSSEAVSTINSICNQVEEKTTAQIALVTIDTTAPLTIEEYAVRLFEKWGIGLKDKDNGALILMAVNDKKVRIETGYGLEGALPDAFASQIIYQVMVPVFKQGDFQSGLIRGTIAVAESIAKEYNVELSLGEDMPRGLVKDKKSQAGKALLYLILFIVMFGMRSGLLFFWILGPTGRRRGGYWYGSGSSGSGGGFGGFGGGFSGGGGASGGW
ncbi:MAG: TPM domain-containing protein [Candidatus Orphnella occulta]|nr:TPM domain-containing protein [Candidatus Orphnella occulta]MDP8296929.1 TPM domain-containing protein [Candidatus Orphnella occulta]